MIEPKIGDETIDAQPVDLCRAMKKSALSLSANAQWLVMLAMIRLQHTEGSQVEFTIGELNEFSARRISRAKTKDALRECVGWTIEITKKEVNEITDVFYRLFTEASLIDSTISMTFDPKLFSPD